MKIVRCGARMQSPSPYQHKLEYMLMHPAPRTGGRCILVSSLTYLHLQEFFPPCKLKLKDMLKHPAPRTGGQCILVSLQTYLHLQEFRRPCKLKLKDMLKHPAPRTGVGVY